MPAVEDASRALDEPPIPGLEQGGVAGWLSRLFTWDEDTVTRDRALALFGGLLVAEGLFFRFETEGGVAFFAVAGLFFVVAMLVASALASEYGWALLGGAAVALGVGLSSYHDARYPVWPPGRFTDVVVPANAPGAIEIGLIAGGAVVLALGLVGAWEIASILGPS